MSTRFNRFNLGFVVSVLLLLNACGFQLRGGATIPAEYNPLFLQAEELSPAQLNTVRSTLKQAGAELLTSAGKANVLVLKLIPLKTRKLVNSSSLSGVELIQLGMRLEFRVMSPDGKVIREQKFLQKTQEVELDTDNVLSQEGVIRKNSEVLEKALLRGMIFQLSHE